MDEAVTLIAKSSATPSASQSPPGSGDWPSAAPSFSSGPLPPPGAPLEEAMTRPISQSRANSSDSPDSAGTPARASLNSNPTNEETVVVSRRGSSKSRLGLAATGVGLLLAGTAAGAYFFSGQRGRDNLQNAAVKPEPTAAATPTPTLSATATPKPSVKPKPSVQSAAVTPTPAVPPPAPAAGAGNLLFQAKALEDQEQYDEAIAKYREYQQANRGSAESGLAISRINILANVKRLLAEAQADMQMGRYLAAREKYRTAMQLKPNSQTARAGFAEARAKASTQMNGPQGRPFPPPEGEPPTGNQGRRRRFPRPIPQPPQPEKQP